MRCLLVALSALSITGCYCSHEREGMDDVGVASSDAATPVDAHASGSVDGWSRPCAWEVVAPWQLTDGPGDQGLNDVTPIESGFAVVTGSLNDPPAEPGRFVHRVSLRAPIAERQALLGAPAGAYFASVGLARSGERIVASTWDDGGCRLRALSLDGVVTGDAFTLPLAQCVGLVATRRELVIFDRPGDEGARLHVLSSHGTRIATTSEQHLDATGSPMSEPITLFEDTVASRVRLTHAHGNAMAAWLEAPDGDPDSQDRVLRMVRVDPSTAEAIGTVQTPSGGIAYRDGGLSSAVIATGFVFAFIEITRGDRFGQDTSVVVVRTDWQGVRQQELRVGAGTFQRSPVIRVDGNEALVGFTASAGAAETQVFLGGIECR
jgi:hypothetical protein